MKNGTLTYRVNKLEEALKNTAEKDDVMELKRDMKLIMVNHLPHINVSIMSMKTRINVLTAVNIGAIILSIIISKIF